MPKQSKELYKKYDKNQRKALRELARKLCDDSIKFYDSIGVMGCAYCDIVGIVADLAMDMTFKN